MRLKLSSFFISCLSAGFLSAQSPGGVSSPELWFQTLPVGANLNGDYHWVDYSGDSLRLNIYDEQGAESGQEFTTNTFRSYNGHPAISLEKVLDGRTRDVMLKRTNLSQATIIGVFAPDNYFTSETLLYGLNGRPGQGVWVGSDKIYPSRESGKEVFDYGETEGMDLKYSAGDTEADESHFREKSARITAYYRSLPPSTGIWGERDKAVLTFGSYRSGSNANSTSTFNIPSGINRQFSGYIPEIIAYNRLLTPIERRQVDSYLAIKYGLSLPVSYIGSSGQLIWDNAENSRYATRITALYRDDASGLYQGESSTSYEEAPNYSDQLLNDYYYNNNPNNRTSNTRLLVVGRQYGNELPDGSYMFWGDDNASYNLREIEGVLGLKIMDRKWLIKTNIAPTADADKVLEWNVTDLDFSTNGFVTSVTKASGNSAPETGTAVTRKPLSDINGYLGLDNLNLFGAITLKLGTSQPTLSAGSHDYGYFVAGGNQVHPIIKGEILPDTITTLILANRLELEKHDGKLFLRVNGTRNNRSEITIDESDRDKPFYGSLSMTKGLLDGRLNLRHGGFVDTGNRVELSFTKYRANEFKDNNKGTSFLVIDRSGTGNFDPAHTEYIKFDETDGVREKVIFNNVFFDSDGSGSDVFTFAYRESALEGEIEITEPECNQANGEAVIKLTSGTRAFKYTLKDVETGETVKSGRENSYTIHLTGLAGGEYELTTQEAGGFNVIGGNESGTPTRAKTTNFFPVVDGALEWMISNTTDTYMIGYTTFVENVENPRNIIHYGLKKQGNVIYKIVSGNLESTGVTVEKDDVIRIEKSMSKVTYFKNGVQFSSNSIKWYDYLLKFYGLIDMSEGLAEILNVNATGFFNLADYNWNTMHGIDIEHSDNALLTYRFTLTDPCGPVNPAAEEGGSTEVTPESQDTHLVITSGDGSRKVNATLTSETAEAVTFVIYDVSGKQHAQVSKVVPQKVQQAELSVQKHGVYIVKAITPGNEYTQKIVIK